MLARIARVTLLLLTLLSNGCTVVSANRTFPKLSWYWSADAVEQRRERAAEKHPVDPAKFSEPLNK